MAPLCPTADRRPTTPAAPVESGANLLKAPPEGRSCHQRPPLPLDTVLVVDFGAQYAQLIARRVREARVYSEIVPSTMPVAEMLAKNPKAIILSGGPSSVYADGRALPGPRAVRGRRPGLRHVLRLPADGRSRSAAPSTTTARREYGRTPLTVSQPGSTLFEGTPAEQSVWMSHGDACSAAPEGFTVTAVHRRASRSPPSRTTSAGSTACSTTPRSCTPRTASRCLSTSCTAAPGSSRPGPPTTWWRSRSPRSAAGRRQAGDLRAVRRSGLRGRRRPGQEGHRLTS